MDHSERLAWIRRRGLFRATCASFFILLIIALTGCSTMNESQRRARQDEWLAGLRHLAAEAVRAEIAFWPNQEKAGKLADHISTASPQAFSSGTYEWSSDGYIVVADMLDQTGYLPGRARGKRGRSGVRVIRMLYKDGDGCLNSVSVYCGRREYSKWGKSGEASEQRVVGGRTVLDVEN